MSLVLNESELIEFSKQVEIEATRVLEGLHGSRRGGEGLEFHSSLPYSEGEDIRRIDWKRYAATERMYVRKYEKEEKTGWSLYIDQSASMAYADKQGAARFFAASICFLAKTWGDPWFLAPNSGASLEEAYEALLTGAYGLDPETHPDWSGQVFNRAILVSDFFYELSRLDEVVRELREQHSSVHLIQVVDKREQDFPFSGVLEFEDLETPEKMLLDVASVKKKYKEAFQEHRAQLEERADSFLSLVLDETSVNANVLLEFFENL